MKMWNLTFRYPKMQCALPVKSKVKISQDFVAFSEYKTYRHVGRGEAGEAYAPQILSPPKVVENTRYPLMKHHISSWLFSKFDDFLSFVIYVVRWSLSNKKNCIFYWHWAQWGKKIWRSISYFMPLLFIRFIFPSLGNLRSIN